MRLIIFIIVLILSGCAPEGGGGSDKGTSNSISNPSGKAEAGMCYLLSEVSATSVDDQWQQTGYIPGEMKKNDGTYGIMGTVAGPYRAMRFNGTCYNEPDGTDVDGVSMKAVCPNTESPCNVNHATTLRTFIAEDHFNDSGSSGYQNIPASFTLAKSEIYSFFGFPNATKNFYEMSITGDTTSDAYLLMFESAISQGRSGPQQNDYTGVLGNAILSNNLTIRNQLRSGISGLKIKQIVTNLNNKLASLGFTETAAPIYNIVPEDYYRDLLSRVPTSVEASNMDVSTSCSFDTSGFTRFAYPTRFASIEDARYIALRYISGNVSIWTEKTCTQGVDSFPCPNANVMEIEALNEILLPSGSYNYDLREHSLSSSVNYFFVQMKDTDFRPTRVCLNGVSLPFGSPLASDDDGSTWIGYNNTTSFYQRAVAYELWD